MQKNELIEKIAERTGMTKKAAREAVNAYHELLIETLAKGENVQITGFGSFSVRQRAERIGFNPMKKEQITIPASKAPAFKPTKNFKDALNKN